MKKWPACEIRQTEAGPVTVMAYAGTRTPKRGRSVFVCGYCENPGGGFRVELEVKAADREALANVLLGLPPDGIPR